MAAEINKQQIDEEILPFLSTDARLDLRTIAMQYFLGLTGTQEGCKFIGTNDKYLAAIVSISEDISQPAINKDALLALVNLSTETDLAKKLIMLKDKPNMVYNFLKSILNAETLHADIMCSILSNLTRNETCSEKVVDIVIKHKEDIGFDKIISVFCKENYNKHHANLHYLGMILANLTQIKDTRKYVLDKKHWVLQRLLSFTMYKDSLMRRASVALILKNCCFETEYHEWLLSDEVDILPRLLLPLAGGEEFDDEDMEKLPDELQYLDPDKQREEDPDIRKILLDAIYKLCAAKPCRDFIKSKNTYVILRELHKWEKDPAALDACENLVQLLISDEPEKGMENLNEVEIPQDVEEKLAKGHSERMKEIQQETLEMELNADKTDTVAEITSEK